MGDIPTPDKRFPASAEFSKTAKVRQQQVIVMRSPHAARNQKKQKTVDKKRVRRNAPQPQQRIIARHSPHMGSDIASGQRPLR